MLVAMICLPIDQGIFCATEMSRARARGTERDCVEL